MEKEKLKKLDLFENKIVKEINQYLTDNLVLPECGVLDIKYMDDTTHVICLLDNENPWLEKISVDDYRVFNYIVNKYNNKIVTASNGNNGFIKKLDTSNITNVLNEIENSEEEYIRLKKEIFTI